MKIGVLGSGVVGQTLAKGFQKHGYEVMIGSRETTKLKEFTKESGINSGVFSEVASFGKIIVHAGNGIYAKDILKLAGEKNLDGKTIIDTTNPIAESPPENGVLKFFTELDKSLMEELQEEFPKANFVKAFSCIGNAFMVNPEFKDGKPTMFIAGNHEESKKQVFEILDKFGFEVEDMGKATSARAIEPLCILWCLPGILKNEWSHAFKLLKK